MSNSAVMNGPAFSLTRREVLDQTGILTASLALPRGCPATCRGTLFLQNPDLVMTKTGGAPDSLPPAIKLDFCPVAL